MDSYKPFRTSPPVNIVNFTRWYDHISPLFKELNWLPVATQLYKRTAIRALKCRTGFAKQHLSFHIIG